MKNFRLTALDRLLRKRQDPTPVDLRVAETVLDTPQLAHPPFRITASPTCCGTQSRALWLKDEIIFSLEEQEPDVWYLHWHMGRLHIFPYQIFSLLCLPTEEECIELLGHPLPTVPPLPI